MTAVNPFASVTYLPAAAGMAAFIGTGRTAAATLIDQPRAH
jgi:hypothetical protein